MDYAQELKNLLRPLKIYELDEGAGAAELQVTGGALDGIFTALSDAEREACVATATGEGLAAYESILPYVPSYDSTESRRNAIAALLRIDGCSFTSAALNGTLAGCGIAALAEETEAGQTVRVRFPQNRGIPDNIALLKKRIEDILPCHLAVEYFYAYILWRELEALMGCWEILSADAECWEELEKLGGGE